MQTNANVSTNEKSKRKFSTLDIVGIILMIIFLPIIIVNMILVIQGWTNPDKVPMLFERAPLIVLSDSMTIEKDDDGNIINGAFNKNDLIFIKKVDPLTLRDNDIITYRDKDGSLITHRIYSVNTENGVTTFTTVGDYTHQIDQDDVTCDQVIGIYTGRIAGMGGVAHFIQSPLGIVIIIGVPFVVLLVLDILKKKKESNETNSKNAELEAELARLKAQKEQHTQDFIDSNDDQ